MYRSIIFCWLFDLCRVMCVNNLDLFVKGPLLVVIKKTSFAWYNQPVGHVLAFYCIYLLILLTLEVLKDSSNTKRSYWCLTLASCPELIHSEWFDPILLFFLPQVAQNHKYSNPNEASSVMTHQINLPIITLIWRPEEIKYVRGTWGF